MGHVTHYDWIDNARGAAALGVVLLHVSSFFVTGISDLSTFGWLIANAVDSSVRWCVPVFIMITGFLLIGDEGSGSFRYFYERKFRRLMPPLVFFSLFYMSVTAATSLIKDGAINIKDLLFRLASGVPYSHMWYLYMLIGLYVITPFAVRLIYALSQTSLILLCLGLFFMGAVNGVQKTIQHDSSFSLFVFLFLPYLGYFLAGYLIGSGVFKIKYSEVLMTASLFVMVICSYVFSICFDLNIGLYFYNYLSITCIPYSIAVFSTFRSSASRVFLFFSKESFGIYLLHPFFLDGIHFLYGKFEHENPILAIPALFVIVVFLSFISTRVLLSFRLTHNLV